MPLLLSNSNVRNRIHLRGIVQGVGFRPFVYNLALLHGLAGFVFNSSSGVTIEIEGSSAAIRTFLKELGSDPPQLAKIESMAVTEIAAVGEDAFRILASREEAGEFALVSPDAGTCDACWRDFGGPSNRRFGYPFTNCTHCGPRYTIILDIPYDRPKTTMSGFAMCPSCHAEYEDPGNRRFHAQPNACAACGPSLCLVPSGSQLSDCVFADKNSLPAIHQAREKLRQGKILAVKGLGGFLLACDASNEAAIAELRTRKRRPDKPFALMAQDLEAIRSFCVLSPEDEAALRHQHRPIVILPR